MSRVGVALAAIAAVGHSDRGYRNGIASFAYISRDELNHPKGSTPIQLRHSRKERRARVMRRRGRRGRK